MSHQFSALFHRDWYETMEHYQPGDELLRIARKLLPLAWKLTRQAFWFSVLPPASQLPRQGWKIHVSATPDNCEAILQQTAAFCIEREVAFKFSLDTYCVRLSTSPLMAREASGKFITIYPVHERHFCELIEALYPILRPFTGPYILSDKRYKDAEVLFYRYGGIIGMRRLSVAGDHRQLLLSPQGELAPDQRTPYWNPPVWVKDPFERVAGNTNETEEDDGTLKEGRYRIQEAIQLSVDGGVYLAIDTHITQKVIIKEARRFVNIDGQGRDATERLREEYRFLQQLQETGITPAPIDLFWDWEHLFLVEEYIPGMLLSAFIVRFLPLIKLDPEQQVIQDYIEKLKKIWCNLAQAIAVLHERGIIYGDFSLKNIIVSDSEQGTIRLIDLEGAWEDGSGLAASLITPGFSSPVLTKLSGKEQDMYAFGALLQGTLFPMNALLTLEPAAAKAFLDATSRDLGLPPEIPQLIEDCMNENRVKQLTPQQALAVIQHARFHQPEITAPIPPALSREDLLGAVGEILSYIHASADYTRTDRLFPADPLVFSTNPLSLAYGAAGVTYALALIEGEVPIRMRTWLLGQSFHQDQLPPGLYIGAAGIAWALWEMGLREVAVQTLRQTAQHPLLWDSADLFSGAAGYGLTCLRFALATQDADWLERARQVGEWLLHTKNAVHNEGYCWPDQDGRVHLGYARGASGIGLYLLYLGLITQETHFLETGSQAIAFDLAHLSVADEQGHLAVPRSFADPDDNVVLPYWLSGSAGIASVLLRFWRYTGESRYRDVLERLAPDTFCSYSVFPGLFQGLAGLGNFLLDAYQFTGEEHYLRRAQQAARGVLLFKLPRPQGLAFPGEHLLRITTDFGTGGAGIALFLHRLAGVAEGQYNFHFTLDHLLPEHLRRPVYISASLLFNT
ncbi:class III lanthionine synthetase LanKC [Tengunoibacter tsumagoiensis]|uniref:Serine/threonine protein kinase n=1 Tax=Tengunoibacter tsumagoiensis TaxID=2014871 RepID=A0A402A8V6_9CHLR|nr:class III lanthionine synthetase LanKC [Tengunoibacter tsumagoiensis]GCE15405.1 serine/threonine protein kinase [Tengunoibacter tsumagoiensis]